jgi:hypothetical protein
MPAVFGNEGLYEIGGIHNGKRRLSVKYLIIRTYKNQINKIKFIYFIPADS